MTEPNGPTVYVPPSQRDDMLALINANRRAAGLLPQQYPGHDPYAAEVRPPQPPWLPIVLDYLEENGVGADSLLIQLGAANQLRVES